MTIFSIPTIKLFHYITTPLGFISLCCLFILVFTLLKKNRLRKILTFISLFTFWVCSAPITSNYMLNQFLHWYDIKVATVNPNNVDAIVVAGWQKPLESNDPSLERFWSERLWSASQAYFTIQSAQHKRIPIIVTSSQFPMPDAPRQNEKTYAKHKLLKWGVADSSIIEVPGRSTREAMLFSYNALQKLNARHILLAGYPLRLIRKRESLEQLFKNDGGSNYSIHTQLADHEHAPVTLSPFIVSHWLPNEKSLLQTTSLWHEFFALLAYKINHWV